MIPLFALEFLFALTVAPGVAAADAPSVSYITEADIDHRSYQTLLELRSRLKPEEIRNLETAILEILDTIKPELYGLGKKFTYPLVKNQNNELFLLSDLGIAGNRNFDCLDAAITIKNILKKHFIRADVYKGTGEQDIFDTHYFVITEDSITFDGTPVFPILGARHTVRQKVPDHEIEQYVQKGFSKIGGVRPLSFFREGDVIYNSLLGIEDNPRPIAGLMKMMTETGTYPEIILQYQMTEIKDYTLLRRYVMTASVNLPDLRDYLRKRIHDEPDGYARYREMSIAQLAAVGAISLSEEGRIAEIKDGIRSEKPVPARTVNDLRERAQMDMPVAAEFLHNVIYTTYLIQQL